ncbi:MAG: ATP-binding cassette domain-containing protein [Betaproteobacteria bacterium]
MLRRLLTYRGRVLLLTAVLWMAVFCVPLLIGLVNKAIFDRLAGHGGLGFPALFALLVAVTLADPLTMVAWQYAHANWEPAIEALSRANFVRWALRAAGRGTRPAPSPADLLGHMRDDLQAYTGIANEWYRLAGEGLFVVLAFIIMVRIDPLVTLVTFPPLAVVVLLAHRMRGRIAPAWAAAREATVRVGNLIADFGGGVRAVKVAGAQDAAVRRLVAAGEVRRRAQVRAVTQQALLDSSESITVAVGQALVLLVGAAALRAGRFTVGDFVLFINYLFFFLQLPRRIGRLLGQQITTRAAAQRLGALMGAGDLDGLTHHRELHLSGRAAPASVPAPRPDTEALVEFTVAGLSYTCPGTDRGVRDVDLRLVGGTVTVVTGKVGAGKTVLMQALLGLRTPERGEIRWNDTVVDPATFLVPPRVAYKPQQPQLFSRSIRENILLGAPGGELDVAIEEAMLGPDLAALSAGRDALVGPRGTRLSGGQVQRVAAARAFVRRPALYVIDDLSSALDAETEDELWQVRLADRSATYLVVSHRRGVLRRADQIVVLAEGRVEACGPLDDVLRSSPAFRQIWSVDGTRATSDATMLARDELPS